MGAGIGAETVGAIALLENGLMAAHPYYRKQIGKNIGKTIVETGALAGLGAISGALQGGIIGGGVNAVRKAMYKPDNNK